MSVQPKETVPQHATLATYSSSDIQHHTSAFTSSRAACNMCKPYVPLHQQPNSSAMPTPLSVYAAALHPLPLNTCRDRAKERREGLNIDFADAEQDLAARGLGHTALQSLSIGKAGAGWCSDLA